MWCCRDDKQSRFEGFAFFQKTFKKITPPSWPRCEKWIKNICLSGENVTVPKHYEEICWQNIVMGGIDYYRKMMSGTNRNAL
jgi:hypothetical protein